MLSSCYKVGKWQLVRVVHLNLTIFLSQIFRQFWTFLDPLWTLLSLCSQVGLGAIYKANLFLSAEETIIDRE